MLQRVQNTSKRSAFKSSRKTQAARNKEAKFEELDIARRNAAMYSSRETLLGQEEEEQKARLRVPLDPRTTRSESGTKIVTTPDSQPAVNDPLFQEVLSGDDSSGFQVRMEVQKFFRTSTPQSFLIGRTKARSWSERAPSLR